MRYIDNRNITDARMNLALDEYLIRHVDTDEDLLLFYINAPSIIIGRHQNTVEEVNAEYVREKGIQVVRRISGGGAVYHDLGNLNFSIITRYRSDRFNRYEEFTRPVIEVLRDLGVPAELGGRNDIIVEGRKISGNAQFVGQGRMLSHGTVLVDSNLDDVVASLNVKPGKIESKGIKSIRSRVANITEFLDEPITAERLKKLVLERVFEGEPEIPVYELSATDWERIEELAETKYGTWEWNYGESPEFNVQRTHRFPSGEVDVRIDVDRGGLIRTVKIFGDFIGHGEVGEIESALTGIRYDRDELAAALAAVPVSERLGGVELEAFLDLVHA